MSGDKKYVCTLSAEMLEKAKKELNEDPNTRHLEIKTLRERLDKVPGEKFTTLTLAVALAVIVTWMYQYGYIRATTDRREISLRS